MISIDPRKVRAARRAAGFRRILHAANATGLDYKTIEAYEAHNGSRPPKNPSLPTLRKLATTYGCTVRDLVQSPDQVDELVEALIGKPADDVAPAPDIPPV